MITNPPIKIDSRASAKLRNRDILRLQSRGLHNKPYYEEREVYSEEAHIHKGNFIGLLLSLNVSPDLFFATMELNRISNPVDFDGKPITLKIPIKLRNIT